MNADGMSPPRPWFFWFAIAGAAFVAFAYTFAAFCGGIASTVGWDAAPRGHAWFVTAVEPQGPAAVKLVTGDQVLTINGSERAAEFGPDGDLAGVGVGHTYQIEVRRAGAIRAYSLLIAPAPQLRLAAALAFLIGILLFVMALWIGLMKPDEATTQVGFGAFMLGSLVFLRVALAAVDSSLNRTALFTAVLIGSSWRPFHLPLGYDFASRFPSSVPESRFWRLLRAGFYVAAFAYWIPLNLPEFADALTLSTRSALLPSWFPLEMFDRYRLTLLRILELAVLAGMCFALFRNYRMSPDADSRRRMRWGCFGLAATAVPRGLETLAQLLLSAAGRGDLARSTFFGWADNITMSLVGVTAIALAYAIVKHRVLGIRVVVRRGVQYLLAKNVLRVILLSPLIILGIQLLLHPERGIGDVLLRSSWPFSVLVVASAALSLRYRKQLGTWVDRKFFRGAYQQEEILMALIEKIKSNDSLEELSGIVAREIEMAFHPASIYIVYRRDTSSRVTLGYPSSSPEGRSIVESLTDDVLRSLEGERSARTLSELAVARPGRVLFGLDTPSELPELLLVPMVGTNQRLGGLLLLGPKKSEEPYTKRDRDLLQAIAGQIAVVTEVLWLKERMREEHNIRVEVLGRLEDQQINLVNECPMCGACYDKRVTHCATDNTLLTLTLPVERVIEGKYRLDRRIGTGGMGAVFEAQDLRLSRRVAVKIMTGRLFGNQGALRRFEREARTAAKLEHPNIVPIFDYGLLGGGGAFLVMQLVRGQSWRAELKRTRAISPDRAANWFEQLCDAVAAAHHAGVIHRDLKPENVIISPEEKGVERITVLDFGLAKIRSEEPSADVFSTGVGTVLGTLDYMSPEQRLGRDVDARSDIYSIGVMAVETLTGQRPPITGTSLEWIHSTLGGLSGASTEEHARMEELMLRCLATQHEARFDTISAFEAELVSLMRLYQPIAGTQESDDDAETRSISGQ